MKKIILAVIAAAMLALSATAASFEKTQTYSEGQFTDVLSNAWYAGDVKNSYEFGLVNGVGGNKFDPNGTVTVAQAITLAARFSAAYNNETIPSAEGEWYKCYVDYALSKKIMTEGQFDSYDRAAKRHEVATLFAASLPKDYFKPLNSVYSIPDVTTDKAYYNALMTLYKAGVAMGSDAAGTFNPDTNITRAEFSALINRVAAPGMRLAKSFDTIPEDDAFMLVDALGMGYSFDNGRFTIPSGWLYDNKNLENMVKGQQGVATGDNSTEDYTALYRDIDEVKSGRITLEFFGNIFSKDDGIYIGFADKDGNVKASIKTDYGVLSLVGQETLKTDVKVSADTPEQFAIILDLDLDKHEFSACINGVYTESAKLSEGIALSRLVIGSTEKGTGYILPTHVRLYQNYALVERFLVTDDMVGKEPYSMNVYGDFAVNEYITVMGDDKYSVKVDAKAGTENVASKSFARISGKGVFETYMFLPKAADGAYFAITSANGDVVRITSKDSAWYIGDTKMRDFTPNIWQTLRIETDTVAKKAVIKICGKVVGEVAISANYIDGVKIGFNPNIDAEMWFDDIIAYKYIDHADYPAPPVANNDDGYNIGINVCNLWHDTITAEGWQAVSPFADLEPWLGYYDEGSPELADWEIKIMAEHGIDFQHFCWYQPQTPVVSPIKISEKAAPAIHDGYFNAKYSDMVKFCIMWENGNSARSNLNEFKEYIWNYWKEYYFSDPRYMSIENKAVLTVWTASDLKNFFGSYEEAKVAVDFMREDIKTLGYDGLIFLTRSDSGTEVGADGKYYYHYSQDGNSADHQIKTLEADKSKSLHVIPTLAMGHNGIGRYDYRVPLLSLDGHKKVAEYIKNDYLASKKTGTWMDNTLFVSTWNEYSEGHYICPSGEFGYGYLENIKDVFTGDNSDHTALDVKPTAAQEERITKMYPNTTQPIRLLRYEDPKANIELKPLVTWDFSKAETLEEWGFTSIEIEEQTSTGIKVHGANNDPQLYKYNMDIDLSAKPILHVRMKADKSSNLYIFFATKENPSIEGSVKYTRTPLLNLGETVDYYIDMSNINDWSGSLKTLRIDPVSHTGTFELELIELMVPALEEATVIANDIQMTFNFPTFIENGDVEVTADPNLGFFSMLNLYHTWNRYTGKLYVESKTHKLEMTVGSDKALLDGKEISLGYTFSLRDGLPVIKMKKFCELLGHTVELKDNTLSIVSNNNKSLNPEKAEYYGWDFDTAGNNEGWYTYDSVVSVVNNRMYIDSPVLVDIHLFSPDVLIDSNKYTKLAVGMYADPDELKGKSFQMFFRTSGQSLDEKKSVTHKYDTSVMKKGELYEFTIDLSKNDSWYGIINDLRVDMYNAQVECEIDYIRFIPGERSLPETPAANTNLPEIVEIKRYDFNSSSEGNDFAARDTTMSISGGYMHLTDTKTIDPVVNVKNVSYTADEMNAVKIGLKVNSAGMAGKYFQIFFATEADNSLSSKKQVRHTYALSGKNDGDLYEFVVDMRNNEAWNGNVTQLRLDPFEAIADVSIDYVIFGKIVDSAEEIPSATAPKYEVDTSKAAYVWNFDAEDIKITGGNGDPSVENGMLALKGIKDKDVQFYFENLEIEANKADTITIGIKANKAAMTGNFMQLFFVTDSDKKLNETKSYRFKYDVTKMTEGEIYPVTINLAANENWKGTVTRLRLDPHEFATEIYIDYIAFGDVTITTDSSQNTSNTQIPVSSGTASQKWDFDSEVENTDGVNVIVYTENGMMVLDNPSGEDIQLYINKLSIDSSKYSTLKVGIKVNQEAMTNKSFQMFFVTANDTKFDATKSYTHKYDLAGKSDGDIYELTIDLKSKDVWKDTVTRLRFDPYNYQSAAYIDYIYLS